MWLATLGFAARYSYNVIVQVRRYAFSEYRAAIMDKELFLPPSISVLWLKIELAMIEKTKCPEVYDLRQSHTIR